MRAGAEAATSAAARAPHRRIAALRGSRQQEATHRIAALRGNKQQEAIIFDDTAIVVDIEFYIKAPKNHFVKAAGGVCNNQLRRSFYTTICQCSS